jgi:hypothetical protein
MQSLLPASRAQKQNGRKRHRLQAALRLWGIPAGTPFGQASFAQREASSVTSNTMVAKAATTEIVSLRPEKSDGSSEPGL